MGASGFLTGLASFGQGFMKGRKMRKDEDRQDEEAKLRRERQERLDAISAMRERRLLSKEDKDRTSPNLVPLLDKDGNIIEGKYQLKPTSQRAMNPPGVEALLDDEGNVVKDKYRYKPNAAEKSRNGMSDDELAMKSGYAVELDKATGLLKKGKYKEKTRSNTGLSADAEMNIRAGNRPIYDDLGNQVGWAPRERERPKAEQRSFDIPKGYRPKPGPDGSPLKDVTGHYQLELIPTPAPKPTASPRPLATPKPGLLPKPTPNPMFNRKDYRPIMENGVIKRNEKGEEMFELAPTPTPKPSPSPTPLATPKPSPTPDPYADLKRRKLEAEVKKLEAPATPKPVPKGKVGKGGGLPKSVGSDALDRKFAAEYNEWVASGGYANVEKNLNKLRDAANKLRKTDRATGPILGLMPKIGRDVFTPKGAAIQDDVESAIQTSLKQILGAQFTEKEGARVLERAYNPRLSEAENAKRIEREIGNLQAQAQAKQRAVEHWERNNASLRGFRGETAFGISESAPPPSSEGGVMIKGGYEYNKVPGGWKRGKKIK